MASALPLSSDDADNADNAENTGNGNDGDCGNSDHTARGTRRAPWHAFVPLWLMCAPAFLLFAALVLIPLAMTLVLTFYRFDPASGPIAAFQFGNYAEVLSSGYFHTIFLRTFGIAFLTTLLCVVIGTPEEIGRAHV